MTINFPSSPSIDDTYTFAGKTWKWNGSGWVIVGATIPATTSANDFQIGDGSNWQTKTLAQTKTILGFLSDSSISPTTADVTAAVNTRYFADISGLTANRNFKLPSGTVGDVIELIIQTGDDTYFFIIKGDTGVSINGGSTATEFHRLQTKGGKAVFVSTSTTNWQLESGCELVPLTLATQTGMPFSATAYFSWNIPFPMRIEQINLSAFVLTTNDANNYWSMAYKDAAGNAIATHTTATLTHDAWLQLPTLTTFTKQNLLPSDYIISGVLSKAGSGAAPGNIFVAGVVTVRFS